MGINAEINKYMSADDFYKYRNLANYLQFDCNYFNLVDYGKACYICNGIGAYWFPEILRKLINSLNPDLVIVAQNHDLGFALGEESEEAFAAINAAFRENGYKVAKYKHAWYSPRRYRTMFKAWNFARLCQKYGWKTYLNGIRKYKAQMEAEKLAETSM